MNEDIELTQEDRLADLTSAYVKLRGNLGTGAVDPEKATALAQLSIAISMLERESYAEGEYEEEEEEDEEEV
ncbi:MAG TPA: hypothetical protein VJP85_08590 [Candidatus Baltobacteraceae bacterium]|nr:hypothetical protein [Candidatus Baltobacteraceae bacterium]